MRWEWTLLTGLAVFLGVVHVAQGQATKPTDSSAPAAASPASASQLRAQLHRTTAELIEAQAAEKPDPKQIDRLRAQMQSLRSQIQASGPAGGVPPARWGCAWGGAGRGYGPPWAYGPGRGWGAGQGRGPGWGGGRGWGPGWGGGRGLGPGGGAFVDENRDGVCDNWQRLWGNR